MEKKDKDALVFLVGAFLLTNKKSIFAKLWRGVRVVEGARLESVYTSKGYRGFESVSLRYKNAAQRVAFFCLSIIGFKRSI